MGCWDGPKGWGVGGGPKVWGVGGGPKVWGVGVDPKCGVLGWTQSVGVDPKCGVWCVLICIPLVVGTYGYRSMEAQETFTLSLASLLAASHSMCTSAPKAAADLFSGVGRDYSGLRS